MFKRFLATLCNTKSWANAPLESVCNTSAHSPLAAVCNASEGRTAPRAKLCNSHGAETGPSHPSFGVESRRNWAVVPQGRLCNAWCWDHAPHAMICNTHSFGRGLRDGRVAGESLPISTLDACLPSMPLPRTQTIPLGTGHKRRRRGIPQRTLAARDLSRARLPHHFAGKDSVSRFLPNVRSTGRRPRHRVIGGKACQPMMPE